MNVNEIDDITFDRMMCFLTLSVTTEKIEEPDTYCITANNNDMNMVFYLRYSADSRYDDGDPVLFMRRLLLEYLINTDFHSTMGYVVHDGIRYMYSSNVAESYYDFRGKDLSEIKTMLGLNDDDHS